MFESITKFFKRIGKKEQEGIKSKDAAKERLHLVLMQDRANISADFLEMMKQEIIEVIKKYIDVDENDIDVRLTNKANEDGTTGAPALYANIPIAGIKENVKIKLDKVEEIQTKVEKIKEENTNLEETQEKENKVKKEVETNSEEKDNKIEEDKKETDKKEEIEEKLEDVKEVETNSEEKDNIIEEDKKKIEQKEEIEENKEEKTPKKETEKIAVTETKED